MSDKIYEDAASAVADIPQGASLAVGGFGLCGIPIQLIQALAKSGADELTIISNNCGVDDWGLGLLLVQHRIKTMVSSYVGENKEFERQYLSGELELKLTPQGTLAEKLRAGGAGIAAFYTRAGVGTQVAEGGLPEKYDADGVVVQKSTAKETAQFSLRGTREEFVLEKAIATDYSLVHAKKADTNGNLVFDKAARNFNPLAAMAGDVCIAEVEELVEPGQIDPDQVHLPGIYVNRVVVVDSKFEKRIERRTVAAA